MTQKLAVLDDALKKSSVALASNESAKQHLELKLHQCEEQINQLGSRLVSSISFWCGLEFFLFMHSTFAVYLDSVI
jgi:hypothetical protein